MSPPIFPQPRLIACVFTVLCLVVLADKYPVIGVWDGFDEETGNAPLRRNIDDIYQERGPTWDLYILGYSSFQRSNESDIDSYYQIAGIHGSPWKPWNGVERDPNGEPRAGYCPHNDFLFALWHRPFVALFEQVLAKHIQGVAKEYNDTVRGKYQRAADGWRLPFWDWASEHPVPPATTMEQITVNGPRGPETVPNPLFEYRFQSFPHDMSLFPTDMSRYHETKRCPDGQGTSHPAMANSGILREAGPIKDAVYNTFVRTSDFDTMSSIRSKGSSFEGPHNRIHVLSGCDGSMKRTAYSSFDPLFMLHHCNVDRLIALWQAIYPTSSPLARPYLAGTDLFATAPGTRIDADSPLKPFYDSEGNFWTSNSARYIGAFGYSYPELQTESELTAAEMSTHVKARVNALYGPPIDPAAVARRAGRAPGREYFIELEVDRAELELPCSINVYLGKTFAGSMTLLDMPATGMSHTEIPLRRALASADTDPFAFEPALGYIRDSFKLDIRKASGKLIDRTTVPSLKVRLQVDSLLQRTSNMELPRYAKAETIDLSDGPSFSSFSSTSSSS